MAEVIRYILLVNIFLAGLSLFYKLFLEKENWHRFNRIILTGGVILALLIPLWQLDLVESPEQALLVISDNNIWTGSAKPDILLEEIQIYGEAPFIFPWMDLFKTLYLIGIMVMGILLTLKLKRIKDLQRAYPMAWIRNMFVTRLPSGYAPFSFFGVTYFPEPLDENNSTTGLILDHEKAHVRQRHSYDQVLVEVVKILFFYNPAIYSIQHQLSKTHEFLADAASANSRNIECYAQALLSIFFKTQVLHPAQAFNSNGSLLKQRLLRLEQKTSGRWAYLKYVMVVPLWSAFLALSAFTLALP